MKHKKSKEEITHYRCGDCDKWWSIADAPEEKETWFCPWCGKGEEVSEG